MVVVGLGMVLISGAAQTDKTPPPELIQYIRDAKQRGVDDAKIKKQAVAVGWSPAAVDEAMAYEKGEKKASTSAPGAGSQPASSARPEAPGSPTAASPNPAAAPGVPDVRKVPDDYQIGSGDTLQISVWKEPDASVPSAVVRPDGKITVPLIKEVEVAGLTPREAEKKIAEGLSKFISDANVTVVVASITSKKVYVVGGARKEGPLPYTYGMTIMQALSEAGGLTDYAKRKKIYVLRTENGQEYRLDFNYDEVVKGERMEQNFVLLPGDTVVIPH